MQSLLRPQPAGGAGVRFLCVFFLCSPLLLQLLGCFSAQQPERAAFATALRLSPVRCSTQFVGRPCNGAVRMPISLAASTDEDKNTQEWLAKNQDKEPSNDADWRIFAFFAAFVGLIAIGFSG
eukprot:CAMPEP_0172711990 /NCGR_PEP_ID=MMETSP1074-20121228/60838_1 /TAXON_ID=2916 /ORGANISM="Ceratium fusus, Strain PA161109" /LENGTH=122 /DNA_ID=CAMNT_0013535853 /DNA_START=48 /DNA_END=416 /DNA_ORIENTATION=+